MWLTEDGYQAANLDRIRVGRGIVRFLFDMLQGKGDEVALDELLAAGLACTVSQVRLFDCSIWGGSLNGIQLIWRSVKVIGMLCLYPGEDRCFEDSLGALANLRELFSAGRRFESSGILDPDWVREVSLFVRIVLSWAPFVIAHLLTTVDEASAANRLRDFASQFRDLLGKFCYYSCSSSVTSS